MTKNQIYKELKAMCFGGDDILAMYGGNNIYYRTDKDRFDMARIIAMKELKKIKRLDSKKLDKVSKTAFGGRLEFTANGYKYTAGQFYDLELPQAFAEVLSTYNQI